MALKCHTRLIICKIWIVLENHHTWHYDPWALKWKLVMVSIHILEIINHCKIHMKYHKNPLYFQTLPWIEIRLESSYQAWVHRVTIQHTNKQGWNDNKDEIGTDPSKIEAVASWPCPKSVQEIRSFLGLCSYYHQFVKWFATIAKPLHELTTKISPLSGQ